MSESTHVPDFCASSRDERKLSVMWIWHAAVVAEYRKPVAALGRCPDLDMTLLTPRRWPERAGQMVHSETGEGASEGNFRIITSCTIFTGFYYVYFYPSLLLHLLRRRPDIIYCYEEAHTFIAALVLALRKLFLPKSKVLLYAAQNIKKRYPLPFRLFEQYCFRRADGILACGSGVARTLRAKGYQGLLRVVPLPTDTQAFSPDLELRARKRQELMLPDEAVALGYAGKLVEEKGLRTLMRAFIEVSRDDERVHLVLAGGGPLQEELSLEAQSAGVERRVHFLGVVHSSELPALMNALDIFVLPSETRPNWREQFGRVLVEAMSCGVATVGSNSGEIPAVLGDAGLIFPEGDARSLTNHLHDLITNADLRARLAQQGRDRAVSLFATDKVAKQHYDIYKSVTGGV